MISAVVLTGFILAARVVVSSACIESCSCQEPHVVFCADQSLSGLSLPTTPDISVKQIVLTGNNLAVVNLSALIVAYPSLTSVDLRLNPFLRCYSLERLEVQVFTDGCGYAPRIKSEETSREMFEPRAILATDHVSEQNPDDILNTTTTPAFTTIEDSRLVVVKYAPESTASDSHPSPADSDDEEFNLTNIVYMIVGVAGVLAVVYVLIKRRRRHMAAQLKMEDGLQLDEL